MEVKKNKKELMQEAQALADKFEEKKVIIKTALDELDATKKVGNEHIKGMAIIEDIFTELDKIELQQLEVFEKIKNI